MKKLGQSVRAKFAAFPYAIGYTGRVFRSAFFFVVREKAAYKILIMQLLFTFIEALPIIVVLGTAIGSLIYLVGYPFFSNLGMADIIYQLLVVIVTRELGPLLVAFVVTARSATAIATEIAGMVTSHQIESYISIGIDPISYLVSPRFIGVTASVFFLNLYFSFCGIFGPYLIGLFVNPVATGTFLTGVLQELTLSIIVTSIIKSILFGMVISVVSTYWGFNVERASTEIPVAGIQAVGNSFLGIILVDVFVIALESLM